MPDHYSTQTILSLSFSLLNSFGRPETKSNLLSSLSVNEDLRVVLSISSNGNWNQCWVQKIESRTYVGEVNPGWDGQMSERSTSRTKSVLLHVTHNPLGTAQSVSSSHWLPITTLPKSQPLVSNTCKGSANSIVVSSSYFNEQLKSKKILLAFLQVHHAGGHMQKIILLSRQCWVLWVQCKSCQCKNVLR